MPILARCKEIANVRVASLCKLKGLESAWSFYFSLDVEARGHGGEGTAERGAAWRCGWGSSGCGG